MDVATVEAGVESQRAAERLADETGRDEEHEGERELRYHDGRTRARAAGDVACFFLQNAGDRLACRAQAREKAEDRANDDRNDEREDKTPPVHWNVECERNVDGWTET